MNFFYAATVIVILLVLAFLLLKYSKGSGPDEDEEARDEVQEETPREMREHAEQFKKDVKDQEEPDGSQWQENTFIK